MKRHFSTALWGISVWFCATFFFILFGEHVLSSTDTNAFTLNIALLLVGTGLLLWIVTKIYLLFDKTKNAALKFGLIGTFIGLALDSFILANHRIIFPNLDTSQIIAFTVWMSFAYALYLLIPTVMNIFKNKQDKPETS